MSYILNPKLYVLVTLLGFDVVELRVVSFVLLKPGTLKKTERGRFGVQSKLSY